MRRAPLLGSARDLADELDTVGAQRRHEIVEIENSPASRTLAANRRRCPVPRATISMASTSPLAGFIRPMKNR